MPWAFAIGLGAELSGVNRCATGAPPEIERTTCEGCGAPLRHSAFYCDYCHRAAPGDAGDALDARPGGIVHVRRRAPDPPVPAPYYSPAPIVDWGPSPAPAPTFDYSPAPAPDFSSGGGGDFSGGGASGDF